MAVSRLFKVEQATHRRLTAGDGVILVGVAVLLYVGARLAFHASAVVKGPGISLVYGCMTAYHRRAEQAMIPLLYSRGIG